MQLRRILTLLSRGLAGAALLFLLASPVLRAQHTTADAAQDSHIVTPGDLQQQLQSSAAERQSHIDSLTRFLSSPRAEQAMESARIDPAQVKNAIPSLSDAELASLSQRAARAQQDFAAGYVSNNTLLLIILVLVVVILLAVIR